MTKLDFLDVLRDKLSEEMPAGEVSSNLQYYDSYIDGAVSAGKSEQEVLDELGDPLMIARTIIDTYDATTGQNGQYDDVDPYEKSAYQEDTESMDPDREEQSSTGSPFMMNMSGWGCLIPILILVLILYVIGSILGAVFSSPVLTIILVVVIIIAIVMKNRR